MKIKKYYFKITLLLLIVIIFNVSTQVFASSVAWTQRIDEDVWSSPENEDGKKLIYIVRESINQNDIETVFLNKYGYSIQKYENEAIYKMVTVPEATEKAYEKYGKFYSNNSHFGKITFNDNITIKDFYLNEDYNQYLSNKRDVVSSLYMDSLQSFLNECHIEENLVLYKGIFTGSLIMYADNEIIKTIAKHPSVVSVSIWEEKDSSAMLNNIDFQIKTDSDIGTTSTHFNNGNGYKGTGVKIGIIEYSGRFDQNSPQLSPIYDSTLFYRHTVQVDGSLVEDTINTDHATYVTSIIVGQAITIGDKTYEGIVPNATVYQMPMQTLYDMLNAMNVLINTYGVSVINLSLGTVDDSGVYDNNDREIDKIITQTNVTVVSAAGNSYGISSPAKGYNVIAVGNAITKLEFGTLLPSPYRIHPTSSSYYENSYLTNKPDLVAPGTNIHFVYTNNSVCYGYGTSLSAPMVTGVVAQLHQAVPTLKSNPTKTKALILAGADPTLIDCENDEGNIAVDNNQLVRDKSGLGMLNAVNSVNAALEGNFGSTTFNLRSTSSNMQTYSGDAVQVGKQYLRAGEKIRVVLTFDKPEYWLLVDENYNNNVDLHLYDPNGNIVSSSVTPVDSTGAPDVANNVEVLEFTATTAGEYIIKAKLITYNGEPGTITLNVAVAWTTTHNHIYSDHYVQRPMYPAHYAYCICGKCIEENHTFISGPVGTYCQKCSYIYSYN